MEKDQLKEKTKEPELPTLSYDWDLLGYATVAGDYLKKGRDGVPYVQKSLEYILKDANIKDPWIVQTVTDPEVLRKTIANQLNTYEMFKKQQTVGDLMTRYNGDLTKHLGDNFERANTELSDFAKEKYGEILRKIKEADYIIDGEEFGKSTDEQVEEAQKTKEKYQRVATTFYLLEKLKDGKFRTRVEEGVAVDALNEMYAPKDESKGEEEK